MNPKSQINKASPEDLTRNKSPTDKQNNWRNKSNSVKTVVPRPKNKPAVRFDTPESDSDSDPLEVFTPDNIVPPPVTPFRSFSPAPEPVSVSPSLSPPVSPINNIPGISRSTELPFMGIPDIRFVPAEQPQRVVDRLSQSKNGITPQDRRGPAYRTKAPVEKEGQAAQIAEKMMRQTIALETEELLGVSPGIQKEVMRLLAKKRIPQATQVLLDKENSHEEEDEEEEPEQAVGNYPERESLYCDKEDDAIAIGDLPVARVLINCTWMEGKYPSGAVVISDPYLQYLEALPDGEKPKQVVMATDSQSLRVIYPMINGRKELESVLDSGSQIVSMSELEAMRLGLTWDPDIVIHMQSANKQLEKTLGLAKDVAFRFNDLTVYLQVHILRNPAYKVLLGRPFDVLTESEIKNKKDGSQMITIRCPNTGTRMVVPTFTRGLPPVITKHLDGEDFR